MKYRATAISVFESIAVALCAFSTALPCAGESQGSGIPTVIEVRGSEATVFVSPGRTAGRRGVVEKGARFAVLGAQTGAGCAGAWLKIYEEAWICSSEVVSTQETPSGRALPELRDGQITPWPYAFVREPTVEYRMRLGILQEERDLLPGFGFATVGVVNYEGVRYLKSAEDTLIPASAAAMTSKISEFAGVDLREMAQEDGGLAWVNAQKASVYSKPQASKSAKVETLPRYALVRVKELINAAKRTFAKVGEGRYIDKADLRIVRQAPPPSTVGADEKWIDVDVDEQVLIAYEGARPVFATLISSGRRGPSATVKGEYRIWAKVAAIAMDNTDEDLETQDTDTANAMQNEQEQKLYSLRHVPWTQFFFESYALHGVYWHDRFGNRRSHGCVNLAPADAKRLYDWTSPSVPQGFWSIHATDNDKGTLIRIR